jgi:hypothetical protein
MRWVYVAVVVFYLLIILVMGIRESSPQNKEEKTIELIDSPIKIQLQEKDSINISFL